MNYHLSIIRIVFMAVLLATSVSAVSAEDNATGVCKASCALYDITLPTYWIGEDLLDADGMPPVRGALLYDAAGGETKCHLSYQSWSFIDLNHLDDTQSCHIKSYILPSGSKPDVSVLRAMLDRQNERLNKHVGRPWIKIEGGYMKSSEIINEGMVIRAKGPEKVVTRDRSIIVLREGREYVHLMSITVPESRYKSDEKFRRTVDNVWKNWTLKK